jgi:hypothetical protein
MFAIGNIATFIVCFALRSRHTKTPKNYGSQHYFREQPIHN